MPVLTVKALDACKPKDKPYKVTIERGLQMRIAPDGQRTLLVRYSVKGSGVERQVRLPKTYGDGPHQMRLAEARAEAARIRALAYEGIDWRAEQEAAAAVAKSDSASCPTPDLASTTLAEALREYVARKRRAKDGLALKARTRAEYLAMVSGPSVSAKNRKIAPGLLHGLADKPLASITAQEIRSLYDQASVESPRQAAYAMQVLRAVLRWHGVQVPGNPLGVDTPGRDRIVLPPARGKPAPIPPDRLAAWWRAASNAHSKVAADALMFQLLTGCRGVEIHGSKKHGYPPIRVADVDMGSASITLLDTKNRTDHRLLLSRQAFAIVKRRMVGLKADDTLFPVCDLRKTLQSINAQAKVHVLPHGLRSTFASIAEPLVPASVLKRMLNHSVAGDVTLNHYIGRSDDQLRAGWQAVADFVAHQAGTGASPASHEGQGATTEQRQPAAAESPQ